MNFIISVIVPIILIFILGIGCVIAVVLLVRRIPTDADTDTEVTMEQLENTTTNSTAITSITDTDTDTDTEVAMEHITDGRTPPDIATTSNFQIADVFLTFIRRMISQRNSSNSFLFVRSCCEGLHILPRIPINRRRLLKIGYNCDSWAFLFASEHKSMRVLGEDSLRGETPSTFDYIVAHNHSLSIKDWPTALKDWSQKLQIGGSLEIWYIDFKNIQKKGARREQVEGNENRTSDVQIWAKNFAEIMENNGNPLSPFQTPDVEKGWRNLCANEGFEHTKVEKFLIQIYNPNPSYPRLAGDKKPLEWLLNFIGTTDRPYFLESWETTTYDRLVDDAHEDILKNHYELPFYAIYTTKGKTYPESNIYT